MKRSGIRGYRRLTDRSPRRGRRKSSRKRDKVPQIGVEIRQEPAPCSLTPFGVRGSEGALYTPAAKLPFACAPSPLSNDIVSNWHGDCARVPTALGRRRWGAPDQRKQASNCCRSTGARSHPCAQRFCRALFPPYRTRSGTARRIHRPMVETSSAISPTLSPPPATRMKYVVSAVP